MAVLAAWSPAKTITFPRAVVGYVTTAGLIGFIGWPSVLQVETCSRSRFVTTAIRSVPSPLNRITATSTIAKLLLPLFPTTQGSTIVIWLPRSIKTVPMSAIVTISTPASSTGCPILKDPIRTISSLVTITTRISVPFQVSVKTIPHVDT